MSVPIQERLAVLATDSIQLSFESCFDVSYPCNQFLFPLLMNLLGQVGVFERRRNGSFQLFFLGFLFNQSMFTLCD